MPERTRSWHSSFFPDLPFVSSIFVHKQITDLSDVISSFLTTLYTFFFFFRRYHPFWSPGLCSTWVVKLDENVNLDSIHMVKQSYITENNFIPPVSWIKDFLFQNVENFFFSLKYDSISIGLRVKSYQKIKNKVVSKAVNEEHRPDERLLHCRQQLATWSRVLAWPLGPGRG